jgi:hypothetical protein
MVEMNVIAHIRREAVRQLGCLRMSLEVADSQLIMLHMIQWEQNSAWDAIEEHAGLCYLLAKRIVRGIRELKTRAEGVTEETHR